MWVRSQAVTGSVLPACSCTSSGGIWSSGQREHRRDRLQLRDDDEAVRLRRGHVVAEIHLLQSGTPADRGDDVRVGEIELGGIDLRLVGLHRALVLHHQGLLGGERLLGDGVLREQRLVALKIGARIGEQRLVARERPLCLLERDLVRAAGRSGTAGRPGLTVCPSLNSTFTIWPLIWLCTVTVAIGVTAPSPMSVMGMSPGACRGGHDRHGATAGEASAGGLRPSRRQEPRHECEHQEDCDHERHLAQQRSAGVRLGLGGGSGGLAAAMDVVHKEAQYVWRRRIRVVREYSPRFSAGQGRGAAGVRGDRPRLPDSQARPRQLSRRSLR